MTDAHEDPLPTSDDDNLEELKTRSLLVIGVGGMSKYPLEDRGTYADPIMSFRLHSISIPRGQSKVRPTHLEYPSHGLLSTGDWPN